MVITDKEIADKVRPYIEALIKEGNVKEEFAEDYALCSLEDILMRYYNGEYIDTEKYLDNVDESEIHN